MRAYGVVSYREAGWRFLRDLFSFSESVVNVELRTGRIYTQLYAIHTRPSTDTCVRSTCIIL